MWRNENKRKKINQLIIHSFRFLLFFSPMFLTVVFAALKKVKIIKKLYREQGNEIKEQNIKKQIFQLLKTTICFKIGLS